jgi:hypothetical protein
MTHKEFKLIVKKKIFECTGTFAPAVHYKIGDIITVDESTFINLQSGMSVKRFTREGSIEFDKYNFENEVEYTQITIDYGTRKLGQRNKK